MGCYNGSYKRTLKVNLSGDRIYGMDSMCSGTIQTTLHILTQPLKPSSEVNCHSLLCRELSHSKVKIIHTSV